MDINIEEKSNCIILKLNGNLIEGPNASEFSKIISNNIKANKRNFIIDLEDINYVNSTGLSILYRGYRTIEDADGKLIIANLNKKMKNLLSITKLNTLFNVEETVEKAIESFS